MQTYSKTNHYNCLCLAAEQNEVNPWDCPESIIKLASLHSESTLRDLTVLHPQSLKPPLCLDEAQARPLQSPEICCLNVHWLPGTQPESHRASRTTKYFHLSLTKPFPNI